MYNTTPRIEMIHQGHYHRYTADIRDKDALFDFAMGAFHESEHKI